MRIRWEEYRPGFLSINCTRIEEDFQSRRFRVEWIDDYDMSEERIIRTDYYSSPGEEFYASISNYRRIVRGGRYRVSIFVYLQEDEEWMIAGSSTCLVPWLEMPIIDDYEVDGTIITIYWDANDSNAETFNFQAKQSETTKWYDKEPLDEDNTIGPSYRNIETQLKLDHFNTSYDIKVKTFDEDFNSSEYSDILTFITDPLRKWEWKPKEKKAFDFHGLTNELTAVRWKEFVGYINAVANAVEDAGYGSSWVISDEEIVGIEKDVEMKAKYFTGAFSLLKKICELMNVEYDCPDITAQIKTGQVIYGKYFTDMKNVLDEIVDKINNPPSLEEEE